eukprot:CAMPEP_0197034222 /NCGR_PEP_ID=MMETSP1384-20130603/12398_1 /TAXON_ID=29189 /ORGANISM="Ammonia sp." /LENGTH=433 /DNA_ID=CAMNT_0042464125 /DNA_START=26 /DNA_END=1325 /DNA_ORIENTATION=-
MSSDRDNLQQHMDLIANASASSLQTPASNVEAVSTPSVDYSQAAEAGFPADDATTQNAEPEPQEAATAEVTKPQQGQQEAEANELEHTASSEHGDLLTALSTRDERASNKGLNGQQAGQRTPDSAAHGKHRNSLTAASGEISQNAANEVPRSNTKRVTELIEMIDTKELDLDEVEEHIDFRDAGLGKGEIQFLRNVLKCCDAENGFDLYQLMAFYGNSSTRNGCQDWLKYLFNVIKVCSCALTQIFGIIIIMIDFVQIGIETRESGLEDGQTVFCRSPDYDDAWYIILYSSNLKILAFLFSSFLAFFSVDSLMGVEQGMYKKMKYAGNIPWINSAWLRVGFTVNVFVSIIAVYGSMTVILFSDNSLDMVLNSVALFFIVELDDLLVKQSDYERIYNHIKEYTHEPMEEEKGLVVAGNAVIASNAAVQALQIAW